MRIEKMKLHVNSKPSLQQEVMLMTNPFSQAQELCQETSLVSALVLDRFCQF